MTTRLKFNFIFAREKLIKFLVYLIWGYISLS